MKYILMFLFLASSMLAGDDFSERKEKELINLRQTKVILSDNIQQMKSLEKLYLDIISLDDTELKKLRAENEWLKQQISLASNTQWLWVKPLVKEDNMEL